MSQAEHNQLVIELAINVACATQQQPSNVLTRAQRIASASVLSVPEVLCRMYQKACQNGF